jgi:hypothetical protein
MPAVKLASMLSVNTKINQKIQKSKRNFKKSVHASHNSDTIRHFLFKTVVGCHETTDGGSVRKDAETRGKTIAVTLPMSYGKYFYGWAAPRYRLTPERQLVTELLD